MRNKYIAFFFLVTLSGHFFFSGSLFAQQVEDSDDRAYSLGSPYSTAVTHLAYLQEENYHPDISAKAFDQSSISEERAQELAIKWKQVLDAEGIFIEVDEIPKDRNYIDSANNKQRYVLTDEFPGVFLQKQGDQWLYPQATFDEIDQIHRSVFPLGTDKLLKLLPKLGQRDVLGLHLWQLIGLFVLILVSVLLHKVLSFLFGKVITRIIHRFGYEELAKKYIPKVARPLSLFLVFLFLAFMVRILQLPISVNKYLIKILDATLPILGALVFYNLVDIFGAYLMKLAERTKSSLDDMLVPLVRKVLKIFVIIVGSLYTLANLNVDIWPLLTGLSIGGLAVALAAQDTLKNFFGSMMIFLDKPFQIGDWITSGDIDGTVEEVGFRSTRVRTFRNSLVYVPNSLLADSMVDNHGLRVFRRFYTNIALTYDTPPDLLEIYVKGLNEIVQNHPHTRKDMYHIYVNDMASSSINIIFYIFFKAETWGLELQYRQEIILEIIRLAETLGVRFAFPTQTLHIESEPGQLPLTPVYKQSKEEMEKNMEKHLQQRKSNTTQN